MLSSSEQHSGGGLSPGPLHLGSPTSPTGSSHLVQVPFDPTSCPRSIALGILQKSPGIPLSGPPCGLRDTHTDMLLPLFMDPHACLGGRAFLCPESPLKLTECHHCTGHFIDITAHSHNPVAGIFVLILERRKAKPRKEKSLAYVHITYKVGS